MNGALGYDECFHVRGTRYTYLQENVGDKWVTWMDDSPGEWYGQAELALRAEGPRVLVGGLGLGLLQHHLHRREDFDEIMTVELNNDNIRLITPFLPPDSRMHFVNADFFQQIPAWSKEGKEFDTVIVDIWAGRKDACRDVFGRARKLLETYYSSARQLYWLFQRELDEEEVYIDRIEQATW